MKELSIEEKARRYDEIVDEIKNLRDMLLKEGVINKDGVICGNFNRIFPELKESEDEKIRKALIDGFKRYYDGSLFNGFWVREILAWLEKQGEQKPAEEYNITGIGSKNATGKLKEMIDKKENPAWSEEDESHIRYLIECLEHCKKGVALTMTTSTSQEYINWLKSLRPQSKWKPSKGQMLAINTAINVFGKGTLTGKYLIELHEQLKKLGEE